MCDFQKPELLDDQFFVHQLISEYFKAEKHLWTISESRSENTLQEIYSSSKYFLNKTINIPMRKYYGYPFNSDWYLSRAELFNIKLENPIQKDTPDIILSNNFTKQILEDVQKFIDDRSDLMYWKELSNVCCHSFKLLVNILYGFFYRKLTNATLNQIILNHRTKCYCMYTRKRNCCC